MKLHVAATTTAGAAAGLWYSLQPAFFPYWPATVASTVLGGLGGLCAGMCAGMAVAAAVRRVRRENAKVDRFIAGDDIRSVEERIAAGGEDR